MKTEFFEEYQHFINIDEKKDLLNRCHLMKIKAIEDKEKSLKQKRLQWLHGADAQSISDQPDEEPFDKKDDFDCQCHGKIKWPVDFEALYKDCGNETPTESISESLSSSEGEQLNIGQEMSFGLNKITEKQEFNTSNSEIKVEVNQASSF